MVKLTSLLALSTLIIVPTLASELWDVETRDITEPHLFGRELSEAEATVFARDMEGLFARQQDFEHPDLVRRFEFNWDQITNACKAAGKMGFSALFGHKQESPVPISQYNPQQLLPHPPPSRHQFDGRGFDDGLFERNLDDQLYVRDLTDDDLFERFYDDLLIRTAP